MGKQEIKRQILFTHNNMLKKYTWEQIVLNRKKVVVYNACNSPHVFK